MSSIDDLTSYIQRLLYRQIQPLKKLGDSLFDKWVIISNLHRKTKNVLHFFIILL